MYSVNSFLTSAAIPWFRVLSSADRLEHIPVEHVSVIELPVDDFIRGSELVLSTAIGCWQDTDVFYNFVTEIHQSGASALVLAKRDNQMTLPEAVTTYADENRFPIVQIPWECRFSDLMEFVLTSIRDNFRAETKRYESIQSQLLKSFLENKNLSGAAQVIADSFHCDVVILDTKQSHVGSSFEHTESKASLNEDEGTITVPIQNPERLYGYICFQRSAFEAQLNQALLENYVLFPLILWFDRERIIYSVRQTVKDDFIWKLAKSTEAHFSDELKTESEQLGFDLHHDYTCIVGKVGLKQGLSDKEVSQWATNNITALKEEMFALSKKLRREIMLTYQQGLLILYLRNLQDIADQSVHPFLDYVDELLEQSFPQLTVLWGISESGGTPTNFHDTFLHAKLAQELGANSRTGKRRYNYETTIVFSILSAIDSNREIKNKLQAMIRPVLEYDLDNNTNIMETLKTFLATRNASQTARVLHLHRQSLIYRLNKIENLVGLSLKDPDNLFLLEICLRMQMDYKGGFNR